MHSPHAQSSATFATLLAGLNRIRFIQKRQASNHNKVAQHLTLMVNRCSNQRAKEGTGGGKVERMSDERYKERPDVSSLTRTNTSRQKFKISAGRGKYAMQTTQQDSSLLKTSMDFEDSIVPVASTSQQTRTSARLKQLVESKTANYRMMKEREQQLQVIRRLKSQQSQRILRERVALAAAKKQEGRRRIQDNYFNYIQNIHLEKDKQKALKTRISEQQQKEVLRLQLQQKSQLQQFESSLALQQQLKSFIKERLPPGAVLG